MDRQFTKLQDDLSQIGFYNLVPDIPRSAVASIIHEHESKISDNTSAQMCHGLGFLLSSYISRYIRGDERKPYFEKAIYYLNRAFNKGAQSGLAIKSANQDMLYESIDLVRIASDLARLYIDEKLVRDLNKGEQLCAYIWQNTIDYEPIFCSYAELFYKKGEYGSCLNTALATHQRGIATQKKDGLPAAPAPLNIAGKALRALVRQEKKLGNMSKAVEYGRLSVQLGVASENDKKILKAMQGA